MEQEICQFLDNDIEGCLRDAIDSACRHKARTRPAITRIANETALSANQLLQRAKEEFPDNAIILEKVHELEERAGADEIMHTLEARLGLRFVEGLRAKLTEEILDELTRFDKEGGEIAPYVDLLLKTVEAWIAKAEAQAEGKFSNPVICSLVLDDIDDLKRLYADREALAKKFEPYSEKGKA